MEIDGFQNFGVRRNFLARFQKNDVFCHEAPPGKVHEFPVAESFDGNLIIHLIQDVEFSACPVFAEKRNPCCQNDRQQNAQSFHESPRRSRENCRQHQNPDDRIVELPQKLFPPGIPFRPGKNVLPADPAFLFRFLRAEPLFSP